MKKKLFVGIALLFASTIGSYAFTEEPPATRWDTALCRTTYGDGSPAWGSQCITPSTSGPCSRTSACVR